MPFLFVRVQDFPYLHRQGRVDLHHPVGAVFMYSRFGYSEFSGGLAYGSTGLDDVSSNLHCAFFDIILQGKASEGVHFYSVCQSA